jgi:hypothetical protein
MPENTSTEPTNPTVTAIKCVACDKMLATTAPLPCHDLAWCGCGGHGDYPDLFPWFEIPVTGLAGFRLFRRVKSPRKSWWASLKDRLPFRTIALGFIGGCALGAVLTSSFMVGASLLSKHAPTTASMSMAPHVASK